VPEIKRNIPAKLHLRAKMPQYFRVAAIALLGLTILAIGVGFYSSRNNPAFRLKSEHTRLSKEVVAEVSNYERLETDGDLPKYLVKADRAVTYSDNHQELDNAFIKVFDEQGNSFDKLSASRALYVPEENKNFTAYMAGQVDILTRDNLNVKTEQITYTRSNDTAESDELVEFSRENVRGRSKGARVQIGQKRLELVSSVEIETYDTTGQVREGRVTSDSATYDQASQTIEFRNAVNGNLVNGDRTIDVAADRAEVLLAATDSSPVLSAVKLYDSVLIRSSQNNTKPTKIDSAFAQYDKQTDTFDLTGGAKIETVESEQATNISASEIRYQQAKGHVALNGGAEIIQAGALIKGDHIDAELNSVRKLRNAAARGTACLKQSAPDRITEVSAGELNAEFDDRQIVTIANAIGDSLVKLTPINTSDYALVTVDAPRAMHLWFKGEGLIDRMQTDGRTTIQLNVPDNATDAANKRITADSVRTFFDAVGKQIEKAEATGNAELYVEPLRAASENYKTTVKAPRFDCDFFPGTSNARSCVAGSKASAIRVPTQPSEVRPTQNISADRLTAIFSPQTKDVERMDATGSSKFSEGDRNAVADNFSYAVSEALLRLRGEPTAWDSRARAKAGEIDWNTREQKSYLRGKVSTTYYNQKQSGNATPFSDSNRPVFITSDAAEFDHGKQIGVYAGNARGWQENNFVKANTIWVDQNTGQFRADGAVQSSIYNVRRRENGKETEVPVFASSQRLSYGRDSRLVRYEENVDIRQGTDRISGAVAQIYLNESNEVAKSIIENNVVITQPNRRAAGNYAEYTAADELVVLRGTPATVDDAESGSSSAGELRMYMRENKVVSEGKNKPNAAGRIRSVYKVKSNP
jgi:LPS export ABC transporter protein LptC